MKKNFYKQTIHWSTSL